MDEYLRQVSSKYNIDIVDVVKKFHDIYRIVQKEPVHNRDERKIMEATKSRLEHWIEAYRRHPEAHGCYDPHEDK